MMAHDALDEIHARIDVLAKANYSMGENFQRELDKHAEGIHIDLSDGHFDGCIDKQRLDETLASWVTGSISDDIALHQLAQYRLSYEYGAVTPDIEKEIGHELITPEQRARLPFAKMVFETCIGVLSAVPTELAKKHDTKHNSVFFQREFGVDLTSRRNQDGNSCHSPS